MNWEAYNWSDSKFIENALMKELDEDGLQNSKVDISALKKTEQDVQFDKRTPCDIT